MDQRNGTRRAAPSRRRRRRRLSWVAAALVFAVVALGGGSYLYGYITFSDVAKVHVKGLHSYTGGPFNVLIVGSDSRAGLTGIYAQQAGKSVTFGQRSDVIKIMHIDPQAHTIQVVSIPRDTMVSLLANQSLYTNYNRINVNYASGPSLLVKTIEANFGIPINHVVQVSFGALVNASDALGGVWLNFPYPARDAYSGLDIRHAGCQLIKGFQTLAVVRSRHYEYFQNGVWNTDGSSDFGRIDRQDTFIRAMISAAKSKYNPATLSSFISSASKGIVIDSTWSYNETLGLAYDFHNFPPSNLISYTLPNYFGGNIAPYGDVQIVQEPAAQQLLVKVFGSSLMRPTNPPPDANLQPIVVPNIPVTTTTVPHVVHHHKKKKKTPTTTTTLVPSGYASFNPVPCAPH